MKKPKIVVSSATVNANVRAALTAFSSYFKTEFFTSLAFDETNPLIARLPFSLQRELLRRRCPTGININMQAARELVRLFLIRSGIGFSASGAFSSDHVFADVDRAAARYIGGAASGEISAVYGYEDMALYSLRAAREKGILTGYDLPIAYWSFVQEVMQIEAQRYPQWVPTFEDSFFSKEKALRKSEEAELADCIVVPSQFVFDSLPSHLRSRATIAKFGSPVASAPASPQTRAPVLKVLFVGSMSQRKGLADLFAAINLLNRGDVELRVLGALRLPLSFYAKQCKFEYFPPRSQQEIFSIMSESDLLVLPSLIEGCALVQQEALSHGLPILVTPNTGGDHLVIEGKTGFTVPIRSPECLAEKIDWCAENREAVQAMRINCTSHAQQFTWQRYGQEVLSRIVAYG